MTNLVSQAEVPLVYTRNFPTIELFLDFLNTRQFEDMGGGYQAIFTQSDNEDQYFLLFCDEVHTVRLYFNEVCVTKSVYFHDEEEYRVFEEVDASTIEEIKSEVENKNWMLSAGEVNQPGIQILDRKCCDNGKVSQNQTLVACFTFNPE